MDQRPTASTITDDQLEELYAERERARDERGTYRDAWHSARDRARKRSEERDSARRWAVHLENENAELLDELGGRDDEARERWIEKQLAETGLKALDFRNGMAMELEPAREMVAHWVGAARAMLGDAPNYSETPIEMEVKVAEDPERFAFVLQRVAPGALTPHQARQQAEARAERAEQQLAAVRGACDHIERQLAEPDVEDADYDMGLKHALRRIRAALDAAGQLDCPGETDPPTCNCPCEGCQHHCAAHQPDTCRTVDIDGETIRVRGAGDPADTREEASR